jgi:hypothetical protein
MTLKYVGPKALISETGIEFDMNKEDKYVYLNIALQFLNALNHEYIEDRIYTYSANTARLGDDELYTMAKRYCAEIDTTITKAEAHATDHIEDLLTRAKENRVIEPIEREVLSKNITMMRSYIIQRSVNKAVYYCIIRALAERLKDENIDYIITPLFQKFAHVMHSVQGVLTAQKFPINSNIEIYEENGSLLLKLDVINQ